MTGFVQALIVCSIVETLAFVLWLGRPHRPVGWMTAAWAWVTIALDLLLLAIALRVHMSVWFAVGVLLAQDGVFAWRLVLLWRSRRNPQPLED